MKTAVTYEVAMSAGRDAGNRSMRSAGRTAWNAEDYGAAALEFTRLWPEENDLAHAQARPIAGGSEGSDREAWHLSCTVPSLAEAHAEVARAGRYGDRVVIEPRGIAAIPEPWPGLGGVPARTVYDLWTTFSPIAGGSDAPRRQAGDICPDCELIQLPGALCPLHAAAPELRDALRALVERVDGMTDWLAYAGRLLARIGG
jgi:hypothetical protein